MLETHKEKLGRGGWKVGRVGVRWSPVEEVPEAEAESEEGQGNMQQSVS